MSIKALVVDDSAIIRKVVSDLLNSDPEIEVISTAPNGEIAIEKVRKYKPDIITLDVEMPGLCGIETLRRLKLDIPDIKVIMVSSHTEAGARVTIEALTLGANDYITKPSSSSNGLSKEGFSIKLIEKIKSINLQNNKKVLSEKLTTAPISKFNFKTKLTKIELVLIGISTGGPKALATFIPKLPKEFPVPILVVQHMPATFTKLLAERLNEQAELLVVEATEGMHAKAGCVYIAPGGFHMEVIKQNNNWVLTLNQNEPENSCRPAVDPLFRSAVACAGSNILAVMMTGMGQDGLLGCKAVKEKGGMVLCQDQESSVVWGMPGQVVQSALADGVHSLDNLSNEVQKAFIKTGQIK